MGFGGRSFTIVLHKKSIENVLMQKCREIGDLQEINGYLCEATPTLTVRNEMQHLQRQSAHDL